MLTFHITLKQNVTKETINTRKSYNSALEKFIFLKKLFYKRLYEFNQQ